MSLTARAVPETTLNIHALPLVEATAESLEGYGCLVAEPEDQAIEIVTWPQPGWRPLDPGTGNEGGTTEGTFAFWWAGDLLYGRNEAVGGEYHLGWACDPAAASAEAPTAPRERVLIYHANYHPDGGQMFFPLDGQPFVSPLALPGDDVRPEHFKAFYFDGTQGLYIHPGVWHEAVFPLADRARFFDRQGKVHARISCDFEQEFGCLLEVPLVRP